MKPQGPTRFRRGGLTRRRERLEKLTKLLKRDGASVSTGCSQVLCVSQVLELTDST